jgi:hypothetical protein
MRVVISCALCIYVVSSTCCADETKSFTFVYHKHYQNEPLKPEPFATGTMSVTIPSLGTNISASPFSSTVAFKVTANSSDDTTEWNMANNPGTAYTFAYRQNGGAWTTTPHFRPDTFKKNIPAQMKVGEWTVSRNVNLQPTNGQPLELRIELYVSCCKCNPDLYIPPPPGYANLVVSATIKWTTDGSGVVTNSDVTDFTVAQSLQVDTANRTYAKRGDGGWDCGDGMSNQLAYVGTTQPGCCGALCCQPVYGQRCCCERWSKQKRHRCRW